MEEHVKLDQFIHGRVAHNLRPGKCTILLTKHEDVTTDDINVGVAQEIVNLCLDALSHAYIVRVHSCNEVRLHLKGFLHTAIESFSDTSILMKREDSDFARVHLLD